MYYATTYASPVGNITLACDGENLVGLWLERQKYYGESISGQIIENSALPVLNNAKKWLDSYFAGEKPDAYDIPVAPVGSAFRQLIWDILREIPYGEVITYGDIAKKAAHRMNNESMSSQAVGGAVGHNPISVIIPCHRVVGANGNLTGYAGGIDVKVTLLELEGVNMSNLFIPRKGTAL